ncbi:uncharacterized protein LOC21396860 [Morus notabilis]|nr:uncharacterized protein LOC21396860 [Morus notabilis]
MRQTTASDEGSNRLPPTDRAETMVDYQDQPIVAADDCERTTQPLCIETMSDATTRYDGEKTPQPLCVEMSDATTRYGGEQSGNVALAKLQPRRKRKKMKEIMDQIEEIIPIVEPNECYEIYEKQLFKNKDTLSRTISMIALKEKYQYRVFKSDKTRIILRCVDENCKWRVRATKYNETDMFQVTKYNETHTCSLDLLQCDHRQASSQIISEHIKKKYEESGRTVYAPNNIIEDLKNEFGIDVSYEKAWRARKIALEKIGGDVDKSYEELASFLYTLNKTNPGSVADIVLDDENKFKYMFMAVAASIHGWKHCRPVIVVDEIFLECKHRGSLLCACAEDANNQIFPLAFGIGESENDESWEYFFKRLSEAFSERDGMWIVSDQHPSIHEEAAKSYPNALLGYCNCQLLQNLEVKFRGVSKALAENFKGASGAYDKEEFEFYMSKLDKAHGGIRKYLEGVGLQKWARAFSPKSRYGVMTLNIAESMNIHDENVRDMPVATLMEWLRSMLQDWFCIRRQNAEVASTKLAEEAENEVRKNFEESSKLTTKPTNDDIFEVYNKNKSWVVNMKQKTCTCGRLEHDQLPCSHSIAASNKMNMGIYKYSSYYYTNEALQNTYHHTVHPLGDSSTWNVPDNIKAMKIFAPSTKNPPGRPRTNKIPSAEETEKTKVKCGRCGRFGHNRKTCKC